MIRLQAGVTTSCFYLFKFPLCDICISVALSSHAKTYKNGRFLRIIIIVFAILHSSVIKEKAWSYKQCIPSSKLHFFHLLESTSLLTAFQEARAYPSIVTLQPQVYLASQYSPTRSQHMESSKCMRIWKRSVIWHNMIDRSVLRTSMLTSSSQAHRVCQILLHSAVSVAWWHYKFYALLSSLAHSSLLPSVLHVPFFMFMLKIVEPPLSWILVWPCRGSLVALCLQLSAIMGTSGKYQLCWVIVHLGV